MGTSLLTEISQLVRLLEVTQGEMLGLMARKRDALRRSAAAELLQLAGPEETLIERMRVLLGHRTRLLRRASDAKLPAESLLALTEHLVESSPRADFRQLPERIARIQQTSSEIQTENRVQWVVARAALLSCEGILELISRRGKKPAIYGKGSGRPAGALIDASV